MTLTALLQQTAERLPPGWQIIISVNSDGAEIELYDPDDDQVVDAADYQDDWDAQLEAMVEYAHANGREE